MKNKTNKISSMIPYITEESELNIQTKSIYDKLLEERIIYIGEPITDILANSINAQLLYLDSISSNDINIYINSPGGEVYSGLAIYDTMQFVSSHVNTVTTGLAASMAYILAISGKKRISLPNSRFMQHQPLTGMWGYTQASDMAIENEEIQNIKKILYKIISKHTKQKLDKIVSDCDRNYWMSAEDAKKYGAIDEIKYKK